MRQLGELKRNADKFKAANAEIIAIFREEKDGLDGLKKIKEKTKVSFTLGIDTPAKATSKYSNGAKVFTAYVIDKNGKIQGIVPGDLRNRAKSKQILDIVAKINASTAKASETGDGKTDPENSTNKKSAAGKG